MRGWYKWVVSVVVLAAVIHVVTVLAFPRVMILLTALESGAVPNQIYHGKPVTSDSREVVRPSPDLLYSACPFDLSEQPLRITAAVPDGYFSVSGFGDNTDNFFVINDTLMKRKRFSMILVGPEHTGPRAGRALRDTAAARKLASESDRVVMAPSNRGVVLFRLLVKERSRLEMLQKVQRQADCRPLKLNSSDDVP